MKVKIVGIPWYERTEYDRIRSIMEDQEKLHMKFDNWLQDAEKTFERLRSQGIRVEKVYLHPEEFVSWCRARGLNINSSARMEFANAAVALKYQSEN